MRRFVIIANGPQPLTIITKRSILDVAAVLDPPLIQIYQNNDWIAMQYRAKGLKHKKLLP